MAFSCVGMFVVTLTRLYPSGFYLNFLQESGLSKIIGTVCISTTLITSSLGPYLYRALLPQTIRNAPFVKRCLGVGLFNMLCSSLMALLHIFLDANSGSVVIFVTIALLRSFQGLGLGVMYVFIQGEVIDVYLEQEQTCTILISSMIPFGAILSVFIGTELYTTGGWVLVGIGVASCNLLPILLLLVVRNVMGKQGTQQLSSDPGNSPGPQSITLWYRKLAFYFPDLVLFLNNLVSQLLTYVLPARIFYSTTLTLTSAVSLMYCYGTASLVSALALSFLAAKIRKFDVIGTMAVGSLIYHSGTVLAFSSTTANYTFLAFPYQLVVGLILMGLGEACHVNLCISSKFALYEKWALDKTGLGQQSAKIYNISLNLSAMVGTTFSALSMTEQSELPNIAAMSGIGVFLAAGLLLCIQVK